MHTPFTAKVIHTMHALPLAMLRTVLLRVMILLACACTHPAWAAQTPAPRDAIGEIQRAGDAAVSRYSPAPAVAEGTAAEFSRLYFGVFEAAGLELALGSRDRAQMLRIEQGFADAIRMALERRPAHDLQARWATLRTDLDTSQTLIEEVTSASGWEALLQSTVILLREGAEAILVVAALAAYLRRTDQRERLPWLWGGVAAGLAASLLFGLWVHRFIASSGALQGAINGAIVLVAALLLAQVSAWLYARRNAQQWNQYLKNQLAGERDSTTLVTAGVAFLAVFREGAETFLFYQALIGAMPNQSKMVWLGCLAAVCIILGICLLVFKAGVRLPFTPFFSITSALLMVLALVFAGKGVLALQMAGWIPSTHWAEIPTVAWLGIYATREGVGIQLGLLASAVLLSISGTRTITKSRT